jgi:hypothetical protein
VRQLTQQSAAKPPNVDTEAADGQHPEALVRPTNVASLNKHDTVQPRRQRSHTRHSSVVESVTLGVRTRQAFVHENHRCDCLCVQDVEYCLCFSVVADIAKRCHTFASMSLRLLCMHTGYICTTGTSLRLGFVYQVP